MCLKSANNIFFKEYSYITDVLNISVLNILNK